VISGWPTDEKENNKTINNKQMECKKKNAGTREILAQFIVPLIVTVIFAVAPNKFFHPQ
jgi:hypothetical protein